MHEREYETHASKIGTLLEFFSACCEDKPFDLTSIRHLYDKHPLGTNLHLIPSHLELFRMDMQLSTKFGYQNIQAKRFLLNALKSLSSRYDFILIDCPPNMWLTTHNGLFASDNYVVVALPEYLSTLVLAHIKTSIAGIFDQPMLLDSSTAHSTGAPLLKGIIFNRVRYGKRGGSNEKAIMAKIRESYEDAVFTNWVSLSTKIATRAEGNVPIALSGYADDRKYEQQIRYVAKEFFERITSPGAFSTMPHKFCFGGDT
jgi:chromosome partitioning protein